MNISTLVLEIVKQMNLQQAAPQVSQGSTSTAGQCAHSFCCVFCSDTDHFLKRCTGNLDGCKVAVKYIQKGLCKASEAGQIVLPNGERVHGQGKDLKEKLDNWHKANKTTMSTNFVGQQIQMQQQDSYGLYWMMKICHR